ncbi:MAG: hypothetical protein GC161_13515 [Planctomycetaceae bacterium]|nr:hypothetical protein [Planctomycetaceae bacterium]
MQHSTLVPALLALTLGFGFSPSGHTRAPQDRADQPARGDQQDRAAARRWAGPMPPGPWVHDSGVLGTEFPQPAEVWLDDTVVHQDPVGGTDQVLEGLSAAPGGFAAVWRDGRHGNVGAFLGRIDNDGNGLGPEQPIHWPRTSRQLEPAVGSGGRFSGAAAWFAMDPGVQGAFLRFFTGEGGVIGPPVSLGLVTGRETEHGVAAGEVSAAGGGPAAGRDNRQASRSPSVAVDARGVTLATWRQGTRVFGQFFGPNLQPMGDAVELDPGGPAASTGPLVAASGDGRFAAVWSGPAGHSVWLHRGRGEAPAVLRPGPGEVRALVRAPSTDGADTGWWLAVVQNQRLQLVHLDGAGAPVGPALPPLAGDFARVSLAAWPNGLILAVERRGTGDERHLGGPMELLFLGPNGAPLLPPRPIAGPDARGASGPLVAANGTHAVVAWTDRRDGDSDVYHRVFSLADLEGQERRWNTDRASADQTQAAVASDGGDNGLIAWEDRRFGESRLFARRVAPRGLVGDEFEMGDSRAPGAVRSPIVAVNEGGAALAVWKQLDGNRTRLLARAVDGENRPLSTTIELASAGAAPNWRAAAAPLDDGGYLVVDVAQLAGEKEPGLLLATIGASGTVTRAPRVLVPSRGLSLRNPALTRLEDGRWLVLFDQGPPAGPTRLSARFLGPDLALLEGEVFFAPTPERTGDLDAVAAPLVGGGFLMAWTGNESPIRDVFARIYDPKGMPTSYPLTVTVKANEQDFAELVTLADGSHIVVWEDDISYRDHIQARRIGADGTLGPPVTVNRRPSIYVEDRTSPHTAPLGGGFVVVWTDRRRGLGLDIFVRVLGPNFDRNLPEPTMAGPG